MWSKIAEPLESLEHSFQADVERLGIAWNRSDCTDRIQSHLVLSWILLDSRIMSEPPPSTAWRPAGAPQVPSGSVRLHLKHLETACDGHVVFSMCFLVDLKLHVQMTLDDMEFHRYPTSSNIFQHIETSAAKVIDLILLNDIDLYDE